MIDLGLAYRTIERHHQIAGVGSAGLSLVYGGSVALFGAMIG